jgi:hypothetical protein
MPKHPKEKKEGGPFLFMLLIIISLWLINVFIKELVCSCIADQVAFATMGGLLFSSSIYYYFKVKPVLNQFILYVLNAGLCLASMVFYVFDLPYKHLIGSVSLPVFLVFCGMLIYTKFVNEPMK